MPAFEYKIQRNTRNTIKSGSTLTSPTFDKFYNNGFVTTPIPASEYQYSWIADGLGDNYGISSGKQYIFGYAPPDGLIQNKISLSTGTITVNDNPTDDKYIYIADGIRAIYFRFGDNATTSNIIDTTLERCTIVSVPIGANASVTTENLKNAIDNSVLDLSVTLSGFTTISLTSNYINERFNTKMRTNFKAIAVSGLSDGLVRLIPAITFPSASEIYGE